MKKIIITIPAYNEEQTIGVTLEEIKNSMLGTKYKYTLQVVDDGSSDKTIEIAKKYGADVISHKRNRGLIATFQTEIENCIKKGADIIVHTDADGQYDPKAIPSMIKKIEEGYDLVLGSRFKDRISYKNQYTKLLGNVIFSKVISKLTRTKITDSTTGFRAFTIEVAKEIQFINTFTYTQEQIIKAARQGFRITEVPIEARKTRESKLFKNSLHYAIKAWINIIRIYRDYDPLTFFGKIGFGIFTIGVVIGLWLLILFLKEGKIGHLPSTILSMLLIVIGVQIIIFGFLADMGKN
ncbi:glycosyltransferase family 2 protein [Candidatus Woesearchaeota archaeon]|nr:MAG: family 2 glycosyl transferase [archaeon GW2011_AR18]MBS3162060.1 glycosyltransferase family 2 protein [Candidatus Woesearchaeota archaeon]